MVAGVYMFIHSFAFVSHWMGISNNYKYNTVLRDKCHNTYKEEIRKIPWIMLKALS